ncbi:uncharacterized protein LOC132304076 [Cornus florida]|uniref:uncharacterized protein LOC132304076 n=1 Tax=Cornus florida TaxID=4283 RepID=UPI0028A1CD39|nr:uncharacterized protein LOC132304076 [Cornus florida]
MPSWLVPSPRVSTKKHSEDWKNIWVSFLIARDLHYNTAQPTLKNSFRGIEFYNPAQLARQMGFTQIIPLPPCKSYNRFFDQRVHLTDTEQFTAIDQAYAAERAAFNFKGHTSKPQSTNEFDVLWLAYISSTRTKNQKAICDSILVSFKPLSPDEEEEILEESEEEEGGEKTTTMASKIEGVAESGDVSIESLYSSDDEEEEEEVKEEEEDALYKAKGKGKTSQGLAIVKKEFQPQLSSSDEDSSDGEVGISKGRTTTQHSSKA